MNGLEMCCMLCEALEQSTRYELRTDRPRPLVNRYQTILKVSTARVRWHVRERPVPLSDPGVMRHVNDRKESIL